MTDRSKKNGLKSITRNSTETGTGTVLGRNNVASVQSRNVFGSAAESQIARYLAYNITILQCRQFIDITVSSNDWKIHYM